MSSFADLAFSGPRHVLSNTQEEVDEHKEYKGKKFMFASYCPKEKMWHVQPYRFILNKLPHTITGQFITSNWFNKPYMKFEDAIFVVVAVKKNMSTAKLEKDFNKLKNPFPTVYDIPPYITVASYFKIPFDLMCKFVHRAHKEKNDTFEFTVRATNNPWSMLTVKIIKNQNNTESILMCLPSFEMPLF